MKVVYRRLYKGLDWAWINDRLPILEVEDTKGIIAVDAERKQQVGAAIFDNWTANSVQVHFLITSPIVLRHRFLGVVYEHLFNFHGLKYLYGMVPGDNAKALKLNKHMGWTEKARLPEAFANGVAYVIMEYKRSTWETKDGVFRWRK